MRRRSRMRKEKEAGGKKMIKREKGLRWRREE